MPDESQSKTHSTDRTEMKGQGDGRGGSSGDRLGAKEPVYLASQLASICDVDLKTIHNWCERGDDPDQPPELECFRTVGGHLRFRQSSVLRFLTRWGYPVPDALLRDKPHVLLVEPNAATRAHWIQLLDLVRPGDDAADKRPNNPTSTHREPFAAGTEAPVVEPPDPTLGLWSTSRYYVHLWNDPYLALVAVGERAGAEAPFDLAVLPVPTPGIDAQAWIRATGQNDTHEIRFILVSSDAGGVSAATERGVVSVVPRSDEDSLRGILDQQAGMLMHRVSERAQARSPAHSKRRIPMLPREPIFVASQVANIWDVDLKTVHNWVERGDIEAFRTPGRHLRFRRRSLLHFLRRYNMAIPDDLVPGRPRVMLVDPGDRYAQLIAPSLEEVFQVIVQPDPVAALVELGSKCAGAGLIDAVVATLPAEGLDDLAWLSAVNQHPDTRYTRVVVISGDASRERAWQEHGALATVERTSLDQVATVLERALGIAGQALP